MSILRRIAGPILSFTVLLYVAFVVVVGAIIAGIGTWGAVRNSVWDQASAQVPRWFALGMGIYLIRVLLPMHVTNGFTRREFLRQAALLAVVLPSLMALLIAIGYWLESLLYRAMDWPHRLTDQKLFHSAGELPTIFLGYWLMFVIWLAAGAFIAAGFYRFAGNGALTIPIGFLLVVPAGAAIGNNSLPFIANVLDSSAPLLVTVALCAASIALGAAMTWVLARDMPIRPKAS